MCTTKSFMSGTTSSHRLFLRRLLATNTTQNSSKMTYMSCSSAICLGQGSLGSSLQPAFVLWQTLRRDRVGSYENKKSNSELFFFNLANLNLINKATRSWNHLLPPASSVPHKGFTILGKVKRSVICRCTT